MKKLIYFLIIVMLMGISVGCTSSKSLEFKNDYESLNDKENKNGKLNRRVIINENNPFEKITTDELVKKIDNKETFYVYFGDKLCPWCRSVIEKSIEVALKKEIKKIYYIPIWDDDGNEIVRDKYEIVDGKLEKTIEGDKNYSRLLNYFDDLLKDYIVTDSNGNKVDTNEKRIYAPNFIYIEDGIAKRLVTGISDKQLDSRSELTSEILKDEETIFMDFFK